MPQHSDQHHARIMSWNLIGGIYFSFLFGYLLGDVATRVYAAIIALVE